MSVENAVIDELTIRCLAYNVYRVKPNTESEAFDLCVRYCKVLGINEDTQPAIIFERWRRLQGIDALGENTGRGRR